MNRLTLFCLSLFCLLPWICGRSRKLLRKPVWIRLSTSRHNRASRSTIMMILLSWTATGKIKWLKMESYLSDSSCKVSCICCHGALSLFPAGKTLRSRINPNLHGGQKSMNLSSEKLLQIQSNLQSPGLVPVFVWSAGMADLIPERQGGEARVYEDEYALWYCSASE